VLAAVVVMGLAARTTPAEDPGTRAAPRVLEFRRVHVPVDRLSDVPLGPGRYVPMSAREFAEGIARLTTEARDVGPRGPALARVADVARYDVTCAADGTMAGTVSFDVGGANPTAAGGWAPRDMSLGDLDIRGGTAATAAGVGEAVVFGRPDGSLAIATPEPGTYTCAFRRAAEPSADARRLRMPLVPALSSTVVLRVPRGTRPIVVGAWSAPAPVDGHDPAPDGATTVAWRIDVGPRKAIDILLVPLDAGEQRLTAWTSVDVRGREARVTVAVRPAAAWLPVPVRLRTDSATIVTRVCLGEEATGAPLDDVSWRGAGDGRGIVIDLPGGSVGGRQPLVVSAVAPLGPQGGRLPLVRVDDAVWIGGGIEISVATEFAIASIDLENGVTVPPEAAARWPLARARPTGGAAERAEAEESAVVPDGVQPARVFVEEQSPQATVTLALAPRVAVLDVARVTAVDLSPGVVVGRAACDVRVLRGEAFDLTARIAAGWFIDSVEVATPTVPEGGDAPRRRDAAEPRGGLDWRVQRDARGDVLRIGLTTAATPARSLGLRITGHRGGTALGESFPTTELDMVRVEGESAQSSLVEVRTSPDMTVEFDGDDQPPLPLEGRLAALAEEGAVRARIRGGPRAESRVARLVRRRPPLDVRTQVRLTVRDDRLTESFTFECQPAGSDLDAFVVQFSQPLDVPLAWSLLPPATGAVSARRLEAGDGRPGTAGERWLVELVPAARGAVAVRGARTVPFTRAQPLPMAWVENATTALGHVVVRDVGRSRSRLVNRRLAEMAPEAAVGETGMATLGEFSYGPDAEGDDGDEPAAELLPGGDARAWAWREATTSWCHASGATEYETRIDLENQGRPAVSLSLPAGRRVHGILLDGVRVPLGDRPAVGGDVRIELPAGRRFVSVLVRSVAEPPANGGLEGRLGEFVRGVGGGAWGRGPACWSVEPAAIGIDVPVLQREWRLALPPGIEVALVHAGSRMVGDPGATSGWADRLFAARVRTAAFEPGGPARGMPLQGFREHLLVPSGGGTAAAGVVVVRSQVLAVSAVLAGLVAGCGAILAARIGSWPVLLICLLAGVAALWCAPPFDVVARAAWWAAVGAGVLTTVSRAGRGRASVAVACAAVVIVLGVSATAVAQDDDALNDVALDDDAAAITAAAVAPPPRPEPLRVFITEADGRGSAAAREPLALVPEELFRAIVRAEDAGAIAPVRVLAARIVARAAEGDGGWGTWRLAVDVDADAGATLVLDQSGVGGRFPGPRATIDGGEATCRLDAGGGLLRVSVPRAGRHLVEVDVEPAVQRRGETETATIAIVASPTATLRLDGGAPGAGAALVCERLTHRDVFVAASAAETDGAVAFDVSRSSQVRLVRSLVPGVGFAAQPRAVVSRNDVTWSLDSCRLVATFDVDSDDAIVRSVVVVADPGLELEESSDGDPGALETRDGVLFRPLGAGRFLVERRSPDRGRMRFELPFRLRLDDPVGAFDVPAVWLEQAGADARTVRFSANPSLIVRVDLPAGLAVASIPESEPSFEIRAWREEVNQPRPQPPAAAVAPQTVPVAARARARLWVERRRQDARGSQRLSVVFGAEAVLLHLDARIDASSTALVTIPLELPAGCVVDRVTLAEDDALQPDTAERGAIDVHWSRTADKAGAIVVQRPRAGRFRLEVDARIPGRPVAGPFPGMWAVLAAESRMLIDWRVEDGRVARFPAAEGGRAPAAEEAEGRSAGRFDRPANRTLPDYSLGAEPDAPRRTDVEPDTRPAAADVATSATAPRSDRVELADIRLAADERGRVWGVACFEMVAAERTVRLRLPPAWRLFDVSVDGRPVDAFTPVVPQSDNVWEFRLLDPGWPRFVVALFVGDLGRRLVDGEPFALPPPEIVGAPCREVIWTVQVPEWIALRVQEPDRIVAADRLQRVRHEAVARLEPDFEQAIARAAGPDQERLKRFFGSRRAGKPVGGDPTSFLAAASPATDGPRMEPVMIEGEAGRLTMRAVRRPDATAGGRALATLSLLAGCGAAWILTRRGWPAWMPSPAAAWPWTGAAAGLAWIVWLAPAWPGAALLLAVAAAVAMRHWPRPRRRAVVPRSVAGEMTTRILPADAAS
jgi:hypothetical protein